MNENKVEISLKEYDELREFKQKVLEGKANIVEQIYSHPGGRFCVLQTLYYTDIEIIKDLNDEIERLSNTKIELQSKIESLELTIYELKEQLKPWYKRIF